LYKAPKAVYDHSMQIINSYMDKTVIEQYLLCFVPIWAIGIALYALFGTQGGLIGFSVTGLLLITVLSIVNVVKKNNKKKKTRP